MVLESEAFLRCSVVKGKPSWMGSVLHKEAPESSLPSPTKWGLSKKALAMDPKNLSKAACASVWYRDPGLLTCEK